MTRQLPLKLKLDQHTRLDDYVGEVAGELLALTGLIMLCGSTGSGKSHLLQGITRQADEAGSPAIYLQGLPALDPDVLEGLESADLVCLDDIDSLQGIEDWERALFHLVNACRDRGCKLVLASSTPPNELTTRLPDLKSRLVAAYHLATDTLDDAGKLEVIRRKAHRRGFEMNEDVCRFILARARRDMHHLAMLVQQLDEATLLHQKKVTIPFVKQALGL